MPIVGKAARIALNRAPAGHSHTPALTAATEKGILSLVTMSKVKIEYQSLTQLDTEAFLEFEDELERKIAREQRERREPVKKKPRRGRR